MNYLRDNKILIAFGNNVRKLRNAKKLSLEALAFEADVELSQIYRLEKGKINPTLTTILAIAKALDIEPAELFKFK